MFYVRKEKDRGPVCLVWGGEGSIKQETRLSRSEAQAAHGGGAIHYKIGSILGQEEEVHDQKEKKRKTKWEGGGGRNLVVRGRNNGNLTFSR